MDVNKEVVIWMRCTVRKSQDHCQWNMALRSTCSTLSSPAVFSISIMMADGQAALLRFILLGDLRIRGMDTLGGGQRLEKPQGAKPLGHSNSTLSSLALCSTHVFILSASPASLHTQFPQWCPNEHLHHLEVLWRIIFPPQTLPARLHILPCAWRHFRQSLPLWP